MIVTVSLCWKDSSVPVAAFLNSGAENNFVDSELVRQLGILTKPFEMPLEVRALNGLKLTRVLHRTVPVSMIISGNHHEEIVPLIEHPCFPLVLGYPLLSHHNPTDLLPYQLSLFRPFPCCTHEAQLPSDPRPVPGPH